ncbi:D-alanine--D-alanine ligase [Leptolyngbya sp. NIES-3755]|nr:D-alanine--D-alanine ligase [Leptolyngbya sp. NIES-3755]
MKVCILQPECSQSSVESQYSTQYFHLLPEDQVDRVLLKKATIYTQLKQLKKQSYDVFVNLCRGYRENDFASCSEVSAVLEDLNLPHTGSALVLYDSPKNAMKHIAYYGGVETPSFAVAETLIEVEAACRDLNFPLFIKPNAATDCFEIDARSYITTHAELVSKAANLLAHCDSVLIEEYVVGREFTVLVAANPDDPQLAIAYRSVEVVFSQDEPFQTEEFRKRSQSSCYVLCSDQELDSRLREASEQLFSQINQGGYACFDFRVDEAGEIFFLDVNYPCSIFNPEGKEAIADYVLKLNGISQSEFLKQIVAAGITRHQRRQKKYQVKKSSIATYGIFAVQTLEAGETIVSGEHQLQRVVTRSHAKSQWTVAKQKMFLRYTYPLSQGVFVLRDPNHPAEWLLQNHSCDPNTAYQGLDLVAIKPIVMGDELTVDFATFLDENGLEFECQCGSDHCRGWIRLEACCESVKSLEFSKL